MFPGQGLFLLVVRGNNDWFFKKILIAYLHVITKVRIFCNVRAGEMAQQLRALAALPEDLSSIPRTHMAAHNHL